jgi:hypothetical protein
VAEWDDPTNSCGADDVFNVKTFDLEGLEGNVYQCNMHAYASTASCHDYDTVVVAGQQTMCRLQLCASERTL